MSMTTRIDTEPVPVPKRKISVPDVIVDGQHKILNDNAEGVTKKPRVSDQIDGPVTTTTTEKPSPVSALPSAPIIDADLLASLGLNKEKQEAMKLVAKELSDAIKESTKNLGDYMRSKGLLVIEAVSDDGDQFSIKRTIKEKEGTITPRALEEVVSERAIPVLNAIKAIEQDHLKAVHSVKKSSDTVSKKSTKKPTSRSRSTDHGNESTDDDDDDNSSGNHTNRSKKTGSSSSSSTQKTSRSNKKYARSEPVATEKRSKKSGPSKEDDMAAVVIGVAFMQELKITLTKSTESISVVEPKKAKGKKDIPVPKTPTRSQRAKAREKTRDHQTNASDDVEEEDGDDGEPGTRVQPLRVARIKAQVIPSNQPEWVNEECNELRDAINARKAHRKDLNQVKTDFKGITDAIESIVARVEDTHASALQESIPGTPQEQPNSVPEKDPSASIAPTTDDEGKDTNDDNNDTIMNQLKQEPALTNGETGTTPVSPATKTMGKEKQGGGESPGGKKSTGDAKDPVVLARTTLSDGQEVELVSKTKQTSKAASKDEIPRLIDSAVLRVIGERKGLTNQKQVKTGNIAASCWSQGKFRDALLQEILGAMQGARVVTESTEIGWSSRKRKSRKPANISSDGIANTNDEGDEYNNDDDNDDDDRGQTEIGDEDDSGIYDNDAEDY